MREGCAVRDCRAKRTSLGVALLGMLILSGLPSGVPLSGVFSVGPAWAQDDPAAFDRSYKESGKLAAQLASRYDSALLQTAARLKEVARQKPEDLARAPLAIETAQSQWPILTFVQEGDGFTQIPRGRRLLSDDDLADVDNRRPRVFVKGSKVLVAVQVDSERYTAAEIPLAAFVDPLSNLSLGGDSGLLLLDNQGRSLTSRSLAPEDQELIKGLGMEMVSTLVSKTSVLSVARVPTSGWAVVVRMPLAEAYRGIKVPELDDRALPNPLYLVKRNRETAMEGVGRGMGLSLGGLALLAVGLVVLRRRLKGPAKPLRMPFGEEPGPFSAPFAAAQTGGLSVLEALVGDNSDAAKPEAPRHEPRMESSKLMLAPVASEGPVSSVWRETLQAEVDYLRAELSKTQAQLAQVLQAAPTESMQARLAQELAELERKLTAQHDSELREFSEALRQRLDLESRRMEALEQNARKAFEGLERQVLSEMDAMRSQFEGISQGLRKRFEQEDQLLASLDQQLERAHAELDALRAQQAGLSERSESQFGLLERELEGYRNQSAQADRQALERIEALTKAMQELHAALGDARTSSGKLRQEVHALLAQAQQENAKLREELNTLSARVHRVVQLLAKGRTA